MLQIYYYIIMAIMNMRSIPEDIKNNFKAICAENGISMEAGVIRLLQEAIKKRDDFNKLFPGYDFKRGQDDKRKYKD